MAKTLIQKIKRWGLEGILGGSLLISSGCATGPLIAGLGAMQPDPRIGAGMYAFGNAYTQIEAAETGRSENKVIIVERPQPKTYALPEDYVFAFNIYKDVDNDGAGLDDFIGRGKTRFTSKEQLAFCLFNNTRSGDIRFVLKDGTGKILSDERDGLCHARRMHIRDPPERNDAPSGCSRLSLPKGIYLATFYIDNKEVGSVGIEVVDEEE